MALSIVDAHSWPFIWRNLGSLIVLAIVHLSDSCCRSSAGHRYSLIIAGVYRDLQ